MLSSFESLTKRGCGRTATWAALFMAMAFLAIGAVPIFSAAHAQAPEFVQHVVIPLNKSVTLPTPKAISSVQVDAPNIVSARAITDQRLYIQARAIGTTSVSIYDQSLQLMKVIEIEVALDTSILQSKIRAATGNDGILCRQRQRSNRIKRRGQRCPGGATGGRTRHCMGRELRESSTGWIGRGHRTRRAGVPVWTQRLHAAASRWLSV